MHTYGSKTLRSSPVATGGDDNACEKTTTTGTPHSCASFPTCPRRRSPPPPRVQQQAPQKRSRLLAPPPFPHDYPVRTTHNSSHKKPHPPTAQRSEEHTSELQSRFD